MSRLSPCSWWKSRRLPRHRPSWEEPPSWRRLPHRPLRMSQLVAPPVAEEPPVAEAPPVVEEPPRLGDALPHRPLADEPLVAPPVAKSCPATEAPQPVAEEPPSWKPALCGGATARCGRAARGEDPLHRPLRKSRPQLRLSWRPRRHRLSPRRRYRRCGRCGGRRGFSSGRSGFRAWTAHRRPQPNPRGPAASPLRRRRSVGFISNHFKPPGGPIKVAPAGGHSCARRDHSGHGRSPRLRGHPERVHGGRHDRVHTSTPRRSLPHRLRRRVALAPATSPTTTR